MFDKIEQKMTNKTKKTDDASHVYRGYRKQILFVLYKLLKSSDDEIICPEGIEDFHVEIGDRVTSIWQVKDYSSALTLSDLKSSRGTSFIKRVSEYLESHDGADVYVAHFGGLGAELKNCVAGDRVAIDRVVKKISEAQEMPTDLSKSTVDALKFEQLNEEDLQTEIDELIASTQLGNDIEASKDLLMWWVFIQSENQTRLTRGDVLERITSIGNFVLDQTNSRVWQSTIKSFSSILSESTQKQNFKDSYKQGISATLEHIKQNCDVMREDKMDILRNAFDENNIVVVRGASGQGKSSLAYRYVFDQYPHELAYIIKEPGSREHVYSICEAIVQHHKLFKLPIVLFYDVSINDKYWPYVIEQLSGLEDVKLLMAIRNEDWQRNETQVSEKSISKVIELEFSKEEAEKIYNGIGQTKFTDFDSSWQKFGGKGPLLEYVYLLCHGEKLEDRLKIQIQRIKSEANQPGKANELELLRIFALVNSYGARIEVRNLLILTQMPAPDVVLDKLNNEYILQLSEDRSHIEGFHPIRSRIIASIVFDDTFNLWSSKFEVALPSIVEEDLEVFLLYAFAERSESEINLVINCLTIFTPQKWIGLSGILKSLLWYGVRVYAEKLKPLIKELAAEAPHVNYLFAFDTDISSCSLDKESPYKDFIDKYASEIKDIVEKYHQLQPEKNTIFTYAGDWFSKQNIAPVLKLAENECIALGESAFWHNRLEIETDLFSEVSGVLKEGLESLSVFAIAELINGFNSEKYSDIKNIFSTNESEIKNKLYDEFGVAVLTKTEKVIKAHYILPVSEDKQIFLTSKYESINDKSMSIIDVVAKMYPDFEFYSTQGHGQKTIKGIVEIPDEYNYDESYKKIPRGNLPIPNLVHLNSTLHGYLSYGNRVETWGEYTAKILKLRIQQIEFNKKLFLLLKKSFKKRTYNHFLNQEVWGAIDQYTVLIQDVPRYPKVAVDKWGFTREGSTDNTDSNTGGSSNKKNTYEVSIPLIQYEKYRNACSNIFSNMVNFSMSFRELIKTRIEGGEENFISLHNILDALEELPVFQSEFRKHFSHLCIEINIYELEKREFDSLNRLFGAWYFVCLFPNKKIDDPDHLCVNYFVPRTKNTILKKLKKYLNVDSGLAYELKEGLWEDKNSLIVIAEFVRKPRFDNEDETDLFVKHTSGLHFTTCWNEVVQDFSETERKFLFTYYWQSICLVFTYEGTAVFQTVKKQNVLTSVLSDNAHFWDMPQEDEQLFERCGIELSDKESIGRVTEFIAAYTKVRMFLGHIIEIIEIPECNLDTIDSYIQSISDELIIDFQKFLDSFLYFLNLLENRFDDEGDSCAAAFLLMSDEYKQFFPDPEQETDGEFACAINDDVICEWKKRLDGLQETVLFFYLVFVFDQME
ncbi:MAG: hypothetical protein OCD01_19560 [Fibrobacterales bacterium]